MRNKGEVFTLVKDGKEVEAEIISCFKFKNNKTYLLYQIIGEEDVYASTLIEKDNDDFELDDVDDDEMKLITELIEKVTEGEA